MLPNIHGIIDAVAGAIAGMSYKTQWEIGGTMTTEDTAEYIKKAILTMYPVSRIGTIVPHLNEDTPQGMLDCDGSTYLRADYPALAMFIDPVFLSSPTEFTLPDLRGRVLLMESASHPLGEIAGEETHTLTVAELASHSHDNLPHSHSESGAVAVPGEIGPGVPFIYASATIGVTGSSGVTIYNSGGDDAHNNMQPFAVVRYAIIFQ